MTLIKNAILLPLPYHKELARYLRDQEKPLWQWLASEDARHDYVEAVRLDLLKATYRLEATAHPRLYELLALAKSRLSLEITATLYQAHDTGQNNAALLKTDDESHIVMMGSLIKQLSDPEMLALLGHELGHFKFLQTEEGLYDTCGRVIATMANDPRAEGSHIESGRLYQLYTEIYADRAALIVCGDPLAVIATLVKSQTGLTEVCALSYLKQAEEVLSKGSAFAQGLDHPETYIRAHALMIWALEHETAWKKIHEINSDPEERTSVDFPKKEKIDTDLPQNETNWRSLVSRTETSIEEEVKLLITGPLSLTRLDLIGQEFVTAFTRRILEEFLEHKWLQTKATLGHAKLFFGDLTPGGSQTTESDHNLITNSDEHVKDYIAFLLLDLISVDRDLENYPLAAALLFARKLKIETILVKHVIKELKIRKRDLTAIQKNADTLMAEVVPSNPVSDEAKE